jgi:hypothetical protein
MDTELIDAVVDGIKALNLGGVIDDETAARMLTERLAELPRDQVNWWAAGQIIAMAREEAQSEAMATGVVKLPGLAGEREYEPNRLCFRPIDLEIGDQVVEWEHMTVADHASVAKDPWEKAAVSHHALWSESEILKGRDPAQLTWGACVTETGVFRKFDTAELLARYAAAKKADEADDD